MADDGDARGARRKIFRHRKPARLRLYAQKREEILGCSAALYALGFVQSR
jgi:hypothetical protein